MIVNRSLKRSCVTLFSIQGQWIGSPRFPLTHMSRISAQTNSRDSGNVQTYAHVYSRFQAGAVKMESFDLRHPLFYSDYCFRHCESWLQAAHAADEDIEIKDLTFVTGINMVNAWALFALPSSSGGCSIQFTTGPTTMLAIREDSQSSNPLDCPPIMNFGPVGRKEPGSLDQCVTIRRFKMHRRMQKLRWKVGQGLRKVIVKRTEVADALTKPESAKEEDIEEDSETSNDNKKGRIRRRKAKPSPGCSIEATDLPNDRRGGGGGGASSGGKDGDPNRGLPPGNGGGRRDTGSGSSGSDSGNGTLGQVTRYTLNAVVTVSPADCDVNTTPSTSESDDHVQSDSEDESVDYKPMEPLDALLEYILEACPSASYACAGDHDLTRFPWMFFDRDSFPAQLKTMKPEVHLQPNGLAFLKDSVYYMSLASQDLNAAMQEFRANWISQLHAEAAKLIGGPKSTTFHPQPFVVSSEFTEGSRATGTRFSEGLPKASVAKGRGISRAPCENCSNPRVKVICNTLPPYSPELCERCSDRGLECRPQSKTPRKARRKKFQSEAGQQENTTSQPPSAVLHDSPA